MSRHDILGIIIISVVILLFVLVYILLFRNISKNKCALVRKKEEDIDILDDILQDFDKFKISNINRLQKGKRKYSSYKDYVEEKKVDKKRSNIIYSSISFVIALAFVALVGFSLSLRSNNEQVFIGDSALLVIKTDSMSTKNGENEYLFDEDYDNVDNQFPANSLISIKKIEEKDIKLFNVYAFKANNVTYVHRLIGITTDDNGNNLYTFRGDVNNASMTLESNLLYEDIVGEYTGFNSLFLGSIISYFNSSVGILTVFLAISMLIFYYYYVGKYQNAYEERRNILINKAFTDNSNFFDTVYRTLVLENIDLGSSTVISESPYIEVQKEEEIPQENDVSNEVIEEHNNENTEVKEEVLEVKEEANVEVKEDVNKDINTEVKDNKKVYPRLSLYDRLLGASEEQIKMYNEIKHELICYGVIPRYSNSGESFRYNKIRYAKITFTLKGLRVYLALNPENFKDSKIPIDDMSNIKTFKDIPLSIKVKSKLSIKRCIYLIDEMFNEVGLEKRLNLDRINYHSEMLEILKDKKIDDEED